MHIASCCTLFCCTAALLLPSPSSRSALASDDAPATKAIFDRWNAIADSIVTAKLRCRQLLLVSRPDQISTAPTRAEINHFFHDTLVPLVDMPDAAGAMSRATDNRLGGQWQSLRGEWRRVDIVADGAKVRNDTRHGVPSVPRVAGQDRRTRVRSDNEELHYSPTIRQATISPAPSQIRMIGIADIRYAPNLHLITTQTWSIEILDAERARLLSEVFSIEYDRDSVFIHHATNGRKSEIWQLRPHSYGGVDVPQVSARFFFRDAPDREQHLLKAEIYVLESGEVNHEISPAAFEVAVPRGTLVVDNTQAAKESGVRPFRADRDTSDVKTLKPPPPVLNVKDVRDGDRDSFPRIYIIVFNAIAVTLVLIAAFITNRRRR